MQRLALITVLFVLPSTLCRAERPGASQLGELFIRIEAGAPREQLFRDLDLTSLSWQNERAALLEALTRGNPLVAKTAAACITGMLYRNPPADDAAIKAARSLVPALAAHYYEADPEQPPTVKEPTDFWRQAVMGALSATGAKPSSELLKSMKSDLYREGDAYRATSAIAARTLAALNPLPDDVRQLLLDRMNVSARAGLEVIDAFGAARVTDPRVITSLIQTLENSIPTGDLTLAQLHSAAAQALGRIGPAADAALPILRRITSSAGPSTPQELREAAERARISIEGLTSGK